MPTPPPLWIETHDAPAAVFTSAFSSGQSATETAGGAPVDRTPRRSRRRIHQRIQQRPVGHRVRAIFHAFGFAERRSHRPAIQVIAPNHDGSLVRPFFHKTVNPQSKPRSLAISQPADASRQSLKLDALASQFNPAAQAAILRKKFKHQIVGDRDVRSFARKRCPPERSAPFAKQRTNIRRNESWKVISILNAALKCERTNVVTVVESDRAHFL